MIRASESFRICTDRPNFDKQNLLQAEEALKEAVEKKEESYSIEYLNTYAETRGLITIAKEVIKQQELFKKAEEDPLPSGAKSYLQELWLKNEVGLEDPTGPSENSFPLLKGKNQEDQGIAELSEYLGIPLIKNEDRITSAELFLTGEADMVYTAPHPDFMEDVRIIRDLKLAQNWKTFRSKHEIPPIYFWQLVSYGLLYKGSVAFLDYVLLPTAPSVVEAAFPYLSEMQVDSILAQEAIVEKLSFEKRYKSYELLLCEDDTTFLKGRLKKSQQYYENLSYEICMGLIADTDGLTTE